MDREKALARLHADLGLKRLNRPWAKLEILGGLAAAGLGLLLGVWAVVHDREPWLLAGAGLLLFVLGGYLALAGSRSHVYQSNNELAAYLAELIQAQQSEATRQ